MDRLGDRGLRGCQLFAAQLPGKDFQVLLGRWMSLQRGQRPPLVDLAEIRLPRGAVIQKGPEVELRLRVTRYCCHPEAVDRGALVLRHAGPVQVHQPEIDLGIDIVLLGSAPVPLHGGCLVLRDAVARVVHQAKVQLGIGMALVGRKAVPPGRLGRVPAIPPGIVIAVALTVVMTERQFVLGLWVATWGGLALCLIVGTIVGGASAAIYCGRG